MMNNFFKKRLHAGSFLVFFIILFSGFYITSFESSSFSAVLRILLVFYLFYILLDSRLLLIQKSFFDSFSLYNNKGLYIGIVFFILYFFVSSIAFSEWTVFRRMFVISVFLLVIAFNTIKLRFDYCNIIYCLGFLGFVVGLAYLYGYYLDNGLSFVGYRENALQGTAYAWFASYDNTIIAALHLSFLCIAAVWSFFNVKTKFVSGFYFVAFMILLLAILGTFARTSWFAIFSALVVLFFYEFKRNKVKVLLLYGILFIAALLYLNFFYSFDAARGLTHRDKVWIGLLSNMHGVKEWLFGVGPAASVSFVKVNAYLTPVHAHNIYVETLYRNGIVGLLLFINLIFFSVKKLMTASINRENIFFIAVFAGACTAMFFDFSNLIYSPNLLWLWVWFPIGVSLSIRTIAK